MISRIGVFATTVALRLSRLEQAVLAEEVAGPQVRHVLAGARTSASPSSMAISSYEKSPSRTRCTPRPHTLTSWAKRGDLAELFLRDRLEQ